MQVTKLWYSYHHLQKLVPTYTLVPPNLSLREAAKEGAAEWEVARAGVAAMQVSPHDTMMQ